MAKTKNPPEPSTENVADLNTVVVPRCDCECIPVPHRHEQGGPVEIPAEELSSGQEG